MVLMNLFAGQQWRHRHREQTYGHRERGEESEQNGESNMETYIIICKTDSQWDSAAWLRELKQELYINLGGGMGREAGGRFKREGTDVYLWLIHANVSQKIKFCKAIILQLKNNEMFAAAPAAAAKSLQSCPTLCDPIDGSPPGSPVPGILQARTLEWVAISFSNA